MKGDMIVKEITIHASADKVFDALARADERLAWWGRTGRFRTTRMESDLRKGGRWAMWFETPRGPATVGGEYRIVERPHLLEFTWRPSWYDSTESIVRIEIAEVDGGTHVRLTHTGLVTETDRANNGGWPDILAALRAHLTGPAATA